MTPEESFRVLERAPRDLEAIDPRRVRIMEMRVYGGLTDKEIASHLQIDERTVKREWFVARAWLQNRLEGGPDLTPKEWSVHILQQALRDLDAIDPRQVRIVELRVWRGLNDDEIASLLQVSTLTVKREWLMARAWLHNWLEGGPRA